MTRSADDGETIGALNDILHHPSHDHFARFNLCAMVLGE